MQIVSRLVCNLLIIALGMVACAKTEAPADSDSGVVPPETTRRTERLPQPSIAMALTITSPDFTANGSIPSRYTCEGDDISPPLQWSDPPDGTKSFALIVDDPDAPDPARPQRTYVHWVVYRIPAGTTGIEENAAKSGLPPGAMQGSNDWQKQTWGGPCPPIGRHRYFFKLYALDSDLADLVNPTKADLEKAMEGHIIGNAQLVGTYEKMKK